MLKLKATIREVHESNYYVLSVPYCTLQYLLYFETEQAYTSGTYGWNSDIYVIDEFTISTGYIPVSSRHMREDYNLMKEYDRKAREVITGTSYENAKEPVRKLLKEFLNKCVA